MRQWLQDDIAQVLAALPTVTADRDTVFGHRLEFIEHHRRST